MEVPQNLAQWLPLIVPMASLAIGLTYFLVPVYALKFIGITGSLRHPDGVGEGRSSFAGFPIGLGACAVLFGQPSLLMLLGLAFAIAAFGKAIHITFDGARMMSVLFRLLGAIALGVIALSASGIEPPEVSLPQSGGDWLVAIVAAITLCFGLICLAMPRRALGLLRLAQTEDRPAAHGELRGTMAGFMIAMGVGALAYGNIFTDLTLGVCWLATAFGRMISMLSDKSGNAYNWLSLLFDLAMAGIPLAIVFGLL